MKKIYVFILLIAGLITAGQAFAATKLHLALLDNVGVLKGQSVVAEGQEFTLKVMLYPGGVSNHAAKIELLYPSDLLEVSSFDLESGWVERNQPGDDLVDNAEGIFVKAGSYSGGVSSNIAFGTVSFLAKKTGSANIRVGGNSLVLDAQDQNVIDSSSVQASINIYEAQQLVDEYREVGIDITPPQASEKVPEKAQEKIPEEAPEEVPKKIPEKMPPLLEAPTPEGVGVPTESVGKKAPEKVTPPVLFDIEVEPVPEQPLRRDIYSIVVIAGALIAIIYIFYRNKKRI